MIRLMKNRKVPGCAQSCACANPFLEENQVAGFAGTGDKRSSSQALTMI